MIKQEKQQIEINSIDKWSFPSHNQQETQKDKGNKVAQKAHLNPNMIIKNKKVIYSMALNACLGTFFFGYNLGVYNTTQKVISKINGWNDSDATNYTSIITAAMPLGAFIGSLFSKKLISVLKGIRKSMLVFDVIAIIGTIILICDHTIPNLIIGRIISGFCIGMNTSLVPEYIKDFTPVQIRAKVASFNQILLTLGVFGSYLMSLVLPLPSKINTNSSNIDVNWRYVLGLPLATCVIRMIFLITKFKYETPTVMISQHRFQEVKEYLHMIYEGDDTVNAAFSQLIEEVGIHSAQGQPVQSNPDHTQNHTIEEQEKQMNNPIKINSKDTHDILESDHSDVPHLTEEQLIHERLMELADQKTYTKRLILGCVIQYATQCSGVNALLFYSNEIFKETTGDELVSRICTIFLGLSMTIYSICTMSLIQHFGRRTIMLQSTVLTIVMLFLFAILQILDSTSTTQIVGIILIFTYMFGWQAGLGSTTWVYNNEILDRKGLALSSFYRWFFTMLVGVVFPYMNKSINLLGSFIIFAILTFMCLIYFYFCMNETKGRTKIDVFKSFLSVKTLQEIESQSKLHGHEQMIKLSEIHIEHEEHELKQNNSP